MNKFINSIFFLKDYQLVEFWFGVQAAFTSLFSVFASNPNQIQSFLLIGVVAVGFTQCHFAVFGSYRQRHLTNLINLLCILLLTTSFVYEGFRNEGHFDIATWGYGFILFPASFSARHTFLAYSNSDKSGSDE